MDIKTIDSLKNYFQNRNYTKIISDEKSINASVALLMKFFSNEYHILFIKRSEHPGDFYSGHIAFPGGKKTKDDKNLVETAVRETNEEVGVDLDTYGKYIGNLDDIKPFNDRGQRLIVTPYIFLLTNNVDLLTNEEVESFIWIPMSYLKDSENMRVRIKERNGEIIEDYMFEYNGFIIWGMTGRILKTFISETSKFF